jgi:transcriptional regulator with XRE-family HTH domain
MRALPMLLPQAFGAVVRELRLERGISQEDLALNSGLDRAHVGHIERGAHGPTLIVLWKLAGTLGVKPATIIRRVERHMDA